MGVEALLEAVAQHLTPKDDLTAASLRDAVSSVSIDPAGVTTLIHRLRRRDPSGLALASIKLLAENSASQSVQDLADLLFHSELLLELLFDEDILPLPVAVSLAKTLASVKSDFDVILGRRLMRKQGGGIHAVEFHKALRLLAILDDISSCHRLLPFLVQVLRHPHPKVRSKAVLLIGRANTNMARLEQYLESEDPRVRANAVESLWHSRHPNAKKLLLDATKDRSPRVTVNALLGLIWAGEQESFERLKSLSESGPPPMRAAAAWGLGRLLDRPEALAAVNQLAEDPDELVRGMAHRCLERADRRGPPAFIPD